MPVLRFEGDTSDIFPVNLISIKFRESVDSRVIAQLLRRHGLAVVARPAPDSGRFAYWLRQERAGPKDQYAVSSELEQSAAVEWVSPDRVQAGNRLAQAPLSNDPHFSLQYYLENATLFNNVPVDIRARSAWLINRGGGLPSAGGMVVAVFDDGVSSANVDLSGRVLFGYDAFTGTANACANCVDAPLATERHGTAVAGIIGAARDNGVGIVGIAPDAFILPVRIFRCSVQSVSCSASNAQIAQAINAAWSVFGAHILNNSWGCIRLGSNFRPVACAADPALDAAIANAVTRGRGGRGAVVVFSAGNEGQRQVFPSAPGGVAYPAVNTNVISVSAISRTGQIAQYAPRGRIDVVAPSSFLTENGPCPSVTDVVTTDNPLNQCSGPLGPQFRQEFGGTSAAAPQVSGVAALLLTDSPNLTAAQVRDRIRSRAIGWGRSDDFGAGKLDAFRTLRAPLSVTVNGPVHAVVGDNTFTCTAAGGLGSYSYRWFIAYNEGAFFDSGNTTTSITQNFVSGDQIEFRCDVTDPSGTASGFRSAFAN